MSIFRTTMIGGAVTVLLASCAGRDPEIQQAVLSTDQTMSCQQIEAEVLTNATTAETKIAKNKADDTTDGAIGVAGAILFWPALLAIDTKNADGVEGNALLDRNDHLEQIAMRKGCETSHYPEVERYQ